VRVVPYGAWPSPLSPAALAGARSSLSGLQVHADALWWTESRPAEGGRQVVLRLADDAGPGQAEEVSPAGVNVRTRVHEYGGAAALATDLGLLFSSLEDGGLWLAPRPGADGPPPRRLSPVAPAGEVHRYADFRVLGDGHAVVAVRERHHAGAVDNELVALALGGGAPGAVRVVVGGRDFVAAPRPSPDGTSLAWLCWDHPNMPFDGTELWVATLGDGTGDALVDARCVDGGPAVSIGQPLWAPDASLWYVSDRAGWWQPWRWSADAGPARRCDLEAEFHGPDWVLGQQTMDFLPDGRLVCRVRAGGRDTIAVLDPDSGRIGEWDQPCVTIAAVRARADGSVALIGSTPESGAAVHVLSRRADGTIGTGGSADARGGRGADAGGEVRYRPAGGAGLDPAWVSRGEHVDFETTGGVRAHALFYPPRAQGLEGPPGAPPPLLVLVHGGPTAACEPGLDLGVQFWTTRGIAVVGVDYRGSSGYGRAYRSMLQGAWGVADAQDCMAAARALASCGRVDGQRMAIRGSSAGGLTALRALARGGPFRCALVAYGVTDLAALAADTHKFESHYTDGLVGPWPEAQSVYEERSPARHPDAVDGAVLLLQGADDAVVPPDQASRMADALRSRGLRCDHVVFPGEGHGWRRAETIARAAELELAFLGEVLGFSPPS